MKRAVLALLPVCAFFTGCGAAEPDGADVTPLLSSTGAVELQRLPPERFDGEPSRIGFEPVPLTGGEFPALTDFTFLPNSDRFLAVNRFGKVGLFQLETFGARMIDSFQIPAVFTGGDCSASSIEIDHNFSANRLFYVGYCIDAQYNVIKRYAMSDVDFGESLYTASNILATGDSKADTPTHAVGTITFGPDNAMWANFGDRGREANAQELTNELGKITRFLPLKQTNVSGYTAVPSNAFRNDPPNSSLIYAYGLGHPWRGAFDAQGRYWVADAGSTDYTEVNVITRAGQNFGWPNAEGNVCRTGSCATYVKPVRFWDTSSTHPYVAADPLARADAASRMAWVGIEYRPGSNDRYKGFLTGKMLYGDFHAGFVRGIVLGDDGEIVSDQHLGHLESAVAWRQGKDGYLYAGTMSAPADRESGGAPSTGQGMLWRVVPLP